MRAVIKHDPRATAEWVVFENRMPVCQTCEAGGMTTLALKITQPGEVMLFSLMLDVTSCAGQSTIAPLGSVAKHRTEQHWERLFVGGFARDPPGDFLQTIGWERVRREGLRTEIMAFHAKPAVGHSVARAWTRDQPGDRTGFCVYARMAIRALRFIRRVFEAQFSR